MISLDTAATVDKVGIRRFLYTHCPSVGEFPPFARPTRSGLMSASDSSTSCMHACSGQPPGFLRLSSDDAVCRGEHCHICMKITRAAQPMRPSGSSEPNLLLFPGIKISGSCRSIVVNWWGLAASSPRTWRVVWGGVCPPKYTYLSRVSNTPIYPHV